MWKPFPISSSLSTSQGQCHPIPPLPTVLPHTFACEGHGRAQDVPAGRSASCRRRGRAGSVTNTSPTATHSFLWANIATPQLQNVLTSAAGRGRRVPPLRHKEPRAVKALLPLRQDWMLPRIHFGLMKAHSSEEKYLHSASQVVTFAQMTHKQAAPRSLFQSKPL